MTKLSSKLASLVFSGAALLGVQAADANDAHNNHASHDNHAHHGQNVSAVNGGGKFSLGGTIDFNGKAVKDADFEGKKRLVFFGFTNCPAICPIAMGNLKQAIEKIEEKHGKDALENTAILLVSTDPKRDTPARMKEWLGYYNLHVVGITGDEKRLKEIAQNYNAIMIEDDVKASSAAQSSQGADADHSGHEDHAVHMHWSRLYVMNEAGKVLQAVVTQNGPKAIIEAIEKHHFSGAKQPKAKQGHDHHQHHGM